MPSAWSWFTSSGGATALGAAGLRAALVVRRTVRTVVEGGSAVVVVALAVPPPRLPAALAVMRHPAAGAGPTVGGATQSADSRDEAPAPRHRLRVANPPAAAPRRLSDPRVRRLQTAIVRRVLIAQCGIVPAGAVAASLAEWSSVAWLRENLLTAAGLRDGQVIAEDEYVHRCEVVFPAVAASLSMDSTETRGIDGEAHLARRHGLRPNGAIAASIYPQELVRRRRTLRRHRIRADTAQAYRLEHGRTANRRFDWYCRSLSAIARGFASDSSDTAWRVPSRRRIRRALGALESIFSPQGGRYDFMEP